MRIQRLSGGLACQVFQYVFMRYGEIAMPEEEWYLDDSEFFISDKYNGYELEKVFGLKPRLLSESFDTSVWKRMIQKKQDGISMRKIFKEEGMELDVYAEDEGYMTLSPYDGHVYSEMPKETFFPQNIKHDASNVYYHGCWVGKDWFGANKELMLNELTFPSIKSNQANVYFDKIMTGVSVALHVRRGDYVALGITQESRYYFDAMKDVASKYDDFTVYVFSDDLYWCNQHAYELGLNFAPKIEYISGNMNDESYVDLQLMSMCRVIIMANSAFSYLASLLDTRLEQSIDPWTKKWSVKNIKQL